MKTIYLSHPHSLQKAKLDPTVMALGYFDGVHLGHEEVIRTAKRLAEQKKINCAVMTFNPHPKEVLGNKKEGSPRYITPLNKKIARIEKLGVDHLYIVGFTPLFSQLTPQQFVDQYLIELNVRHVVAGFDYTYGRLGKGTMETLPFHSRSQFDQTTVSKIETSAQKVSSTLIRQLIEEGKVERIQELLGRAYEVEGTVVHGEKRGRTIGFPTANIELNERYLLPKTGVYAVYLYLDNSWYEGVCNVGYKPTFHQEAENEPTIEVHVLHVDKEMYGKTVELKWHRFLRGEQKFSGVEELKEQIHRDIQKADLVFKNES